MLPTDMQFDSTKHCPKCGKRKVYFYFDEDIIVWYCTACKHTWRS